MILNGPYLLGRSLHVPLIDRFLPSSQTWSPTFISITLHASFDRCRLFRTFCVSCLVSCNCVTRSIDDGMLVGMNFTWTWGLNPRRSSCGDRQVALCFQELCVYSARGRSFAQLFCLPVVHDQRFCLTQVFILSVCPSVLGWKAVDRFCCIPRLAQSDLKSGTQSEGLDQR